MAPTTLQLSGQLRQIVYYHLDNQLLPNALFFAGRLHALDPRGPDSVHLIALCHYRLGQYKAAYDYSRLLGLRGVHLGCSYVFAQACLELERYTDGVTALERARSLWDKKSNFSTYWDYWSNTAISIANEVAKTSILNIRGEMSQTRLLSTAC